MGEGAGAAAALVAVNADLVVLAAVQNGEGVAQPEVQRPEEDMTGHRIHICHVESRSCFCDYAMKEMFFCPRRLILLQQQQQKKKVLF